MTDPIQAQPNKQEHEIDLVEIITVLWRARKFIAALTATAVIFGLIYILFATNMYRSTITLYPAVDSGSNSPMTAMARQLGVTGPQTGAASYNIPDVAKSRTLAEKIVSHHWVINGFQKEISLSDYFDSIWGVEKPDYVVTKEDSVRWNEIKFYKYSQFISKERINANMNEETGLITVTVDMEDPKLSKDIANYISQFITTWVNDNQKESIRRNLTFINERAEVLGKELQDAENELKNFRETNRNILNSPDLQLELQRLQRQLTIKQEVYLTMVKQKEINQIEENKSVDVIRILDKAITALKPFFPNKRFIFAVTFAIGLIFGSALIMTVYLTTNRYKKYDLYKRKFIGKLISS